MNKRKASSDVDQENKSKKHHLLTSHISRREYNLLLNVNKKSGDLYLLSNIRYKIPDTLWTYILKFLYAECNECLMLSPSVKNGKCDICRRCVNCGTTSEDTVDGRCEDCRRCSGCEVLFSSSSSSSFSSSVKEHRCVDCIESVCGNCVNTCNLCKEDVCSNCVTSYDCHIDYGRTHDFCKNCAEVQKTTEKPCFH